MESDNQENPVCVDCKKVNPEGGLKLSGGEPRCPLCRADREIRLNLADPETYEEMTAYFKEKNILRPTAENIMDRWHIKRQQALRYLRIFKAKNPQNYTAEAAINHAIKDESITSPRPELDQAIEDAAQP